MRGSRGAPSVRAGALTDIEDLVPRPGLLQRAVIDWYRANRRDLPWRPPVVLGPKGGAKAKPPQPPRVPSSYGVWVSEIMSQQTQISTVVRYWQRWMTVFPSPEALAGASGDAVRREWAGMGFYRRADNLHRGAKYVTEACGGSLPKTKAALLAVPGIGSYTAGAIASICHDEPVAAVDGNVMRVMTRVRGDREVDVKIPAVAKRIERELERHLLKGCSSPGDFNQGLMEIGATLCRPNGAPLCEQCPLRAHCAAFKLQKKGTIAAIDGVIPLKSKKTAQRTERLVSLVVLDATRSRTVLLQRPLAGLLAGMMEVPSVNLSTATPSKPTNLVAAGKCLAAKFSACPTLVQLLKVATTSQKEGTPGRSSSSPPAAAAAADVVVPCGSVDHVFTHILMTLDVFALTITSQTAFNKVVAELEQAHSPLSVRAVPLERVSKEAISAVMSKVVRRATHGEDGPSTTKAPAKSRSFSRSSSSSSSSTSSRGGSSSSSVMVVSGRGHVKKAARR